MNVLTPLPWENNWAALRDPSVSLWWFSFKNTIVYTIGTVPVQVYTGLGIALLLDERIKGKKLFRAAYFMPVMLAGAVSAVIWRWLLAGPGIINQFLEPLGLSHNWAGDPTTALFGVMLIAVWSGIGFYLIIFLAGLQNIPDELYESARMDGANAWERFRHVTWPSLQETNFFAITMALIWSFQVFGIALAFSEGGPYYATTTTVVLIYQRAFQEGQMGTGSAMSFILFGIIFLFSYYQYRYRQAEEVDY
ncbi:carbohydrate ABC transporter permease [Halocatena marina]|uniref:carbohydrate ABC transporter permease n=1 Tax=Halocatena marina TaxID=2934937 RepID=UPI00200BC32E|nr:sugar ABC transporter permease [Halocatena marina]